MGVCVLENRMYMVDKNGRICFIKPTVYGGQKMGVYVYKANCIWWTKMDVYCLESQVYIWANDGYIRWLNRAYMAAQSQTIIWIIKKIIYKKRRK